MQQCTQRLTKISMVGFLPSFIWMAFLSMPVLAEAEQAEAEQAQPELIVYKQTEDAKGKAVELRLHVFKPDCWSKDDKRPAIVFFFGGGWVNGTPKQFYLQSQELAQRGMIAFSAEYRVKSRHGTTPLACVEDGKSAVRYLRANADQLGIDPDRIAAGGGSAGGHVAACAGVLKGFEAKDEDPSVSSVPNLMVLFNPVIDTAPKTGYGSKKVPGNDPKIISPVHHVHKDQPPALILQGVADTTTPIPASRRFVELSNAQGCDAKIVEYEGANHGFFNNGGFRALKKGGKNYHQLTMAEVVEFLEGYGYLSVEAPSKTAGTRRRCKPFLNDKEVSSR